MESVTDWSVLQDYGSYRWKANYRSFIAEHADAHWVGDPSSILTIEIVAEQPFSNAAPWKSLEYCTNEKLIFIRSIKRLYEFETASFSSFQLDSLNSTTCCARYQLTLHIFIYLIYV